MSHKTDRSDDGYRINHANEHQTQHAQRRPWIFHKSFSIGCDYHNMVDWQKNDASRYIAHAICIWFFTYLNAWGQTILPVIDDEKFHGHAINREEMCHMLHTHTSKLEVFVMNICTMQNFSTSSNFWSRCSKRNKTWSCWKSSYGRNSRWYEGY